MREYQKAYGQPGTLGFPVSRIPGFSCRRKKPGDDAEDAWSDLVHQRGRAGVFVRGVPLKGRQILILEVKHESWLQTSFWMKKTVHHFFNKVTVLFVLGENGVLVFWQTFSCPSSDVSTFKLQGQSQTCWQSLARSTALYGSKVRRRWGILTCSQSTDTRWIARFMSAKGSGVGVPLWPKFLMILDWTNDKF